MDTISPSIFGIDRVTIFTSTLGMGTPYLINWCGDAISPSISGMGIPYFLVYFVWGSQISWAVGVPNFLGGYGIY